MPATDERDLLRMATAGSVDDGKSTLLGRLLLDTKLLLSDHLESVSRNDDGPDLAALTDGLRAEREQGITIDVAYRFFATPRRSFILADTPGHERYTRNMFTGASTADLADLLDGDNIRHGLSDDLSFRPGDRAENIRRCGGRAAAQGQRPAVTPASAAFVDLRPFRPATDGAQAKRRGSGRRVHRVRGAELRLPLVSTPRSDLLRRVLGCLRDHPHHDTIYGVTRRLGVVSADAVEAALTALEDERLVTRAGDHWQLTRSGWAAAHADDPRSDIG